MCLCPGFVYRVGRFSVFMIGFFVLRMLTLLLVVFRVAHHVHSK